MLTRLVHDLMTAWPGGGWPCGEAVASLSRGALAAGLAWILVCLFAPGFIRRWGGFLREPNKSDSAHLRQLHASKEATPTMGGLLVIGAILAACAALGDFGSPVLGAAVVVAGGLAGLGAVDDLVKLRSAAPGLSARQKLGVQLVVALAASWMLYEHRAGTPAGLDLAVPLTELAVPLGPWYVPFAAMVILAACNAVNLTDGLDGLAAGSLALATAAMAWIAAATLLGEPSAGRAGSEVSETWVLAAAMIGALVAFLRFNRHPAQVFLGDTGSLPLGGLLGLLAVGVYQELLLVVVGAVFVAEAVSVLVQVGYYKWRRKRIFLCAPLHHHFQFLGWPERRVVFRFWLGAAAAGLLGIACWQATTTSAAASSAPGGLSAVSAPREHAGE